MANGEAVHGNQHLALAPTTSGTRAGPVAESATWRRTGRAGSPMQPHGVTVISATERGIELLTGKEKNMLANALTLRSVEVCPVLVPLNRPVVSKVGLFD